MNVTSNEELLVIPLATIWNTENRAPKKPITNKLFIVNKSPIEFDLGLDTPEADKPQSSSVLKKNLVSIIGINKPQTINLRYCEPYRIGVAENDSAINLEIFSKAPPEVIRERF